MGVTAGVSAAATRDTLRDATKARDHAAIVALLAPDVVLHSPVVPYAFTGRDAVARVYAAVVDRFEGFDYTAELGSDTGVQVLRFRTTVLGRPTEGLTAVEVDSAGRIADITIFIRPLSSLAAVGAALAPGLARGRLARLVLTILSRPLPTLLGLAEPLVKRLIRLR